MRRRARSCSCSRPETNAASRRPREPDGRPLDEFFAPLEGGTARFGGFAPGTYNLWIDPISGYAPLLLRDVELREGSQELPPPDFGPGSSIRVRIRTGKDESAPRIYLGARHEGVPPYFRYLNSRGGAEVVLSGLGPGTFRVEYHPIMGGFSATRPEATVTLDGTRDALLEMDLR